MNERFRQARLLVRGIGTVAVVVALLHLAATGRPSLAQEGPKPPQDDATTEAARRGLKEKPLAAGRDKATLLAETAEAQARRERESKHAMDASKMDCTICHACQTPTREHPCLQMCPRMVAQAIAEAAREKLPDDMILLGAFSWSERRFMPVPFTHKEHADMAGMAGGCQICHHHSPEGQSYPACKVCHEPVFAARSPGEEMGVPNLKGAYHRQCMGCHREWSHDTRCSICHLVKGDQETPIDDVDTILNRGDAFGAYPPIENPQHVLHKTEYVGGPYVTFRHKEHIDRYGYTCERCHVDQACSRCHEQRADRPQPAMQIERERHSACFPCHEDDACERCHSQTERAEPKPFDHATTGFSLGKYHDRLTCRACHKRLFFLRKLEGQCDLCHKDWGPETFDHAVTGQPLDENHAEQDCELCHIERRFDRAPTCDECHDEDEGFVFPKKRPGPVTQSAESTGQ